MKALVYHGPGKYHWEEKARPSLSRPTDAIVRTTICGTDLHILKGDVPTVTDGRTLGHEGVGEIVEKGDAVANFTIGDRVLISCITSCGRCDYCRRQMYSHCANGGWILGNRIDGTQAEYVRIPFADTSLYPAPAGIDEDALAMLSDRSHRPQTAHHAPVPPSGSAQRIRHICKRRAGRRIESGAVGLKCPDAMRGSIMNATFNCRVPSAGTLRRSVSRCVAVGARRLIRSSAPAALR